METDLTNDDILKFLKAEKPFIIDKYGVTEIGLFGSFASGAQNKNSDIDLLIEFKEPRFEYLAGLTIFLEHKFNRKIEIVRKSKNIKSRFLQRIKDSVIYV
jgi:uncharacterized protein